MKYAVTVAGQEFEVEFRDGAMLVDGRPVDAELRSVAGTPLQQLFRNGGCRTVAVTRSDGRWQVLIEGEQHEVSILDARIKALQGVAGSAHGLGAGEVVRAPMPGMVLRLEVAAGDPVKAGAGILVLEAMKMENEIRCRAGGVVQSVLVTPGQAVEKGALLVEIGPAS